MKSIILTAACGFSLCFGSPASAQSEVEEADTTAELDEMMGVISEAFPREPLTPEQEARLPIAERIIALMIPEGTMGEIMGGLIDDILQPMMAMGPSAAEQTVADAIGISPVSFELDDATSAEIAAMIDPAYEERRERQLAVIPNILGEMMTAMEPGLREVMTELYAIKFDSAELADIEGFFSTETGAKYARESFAMASDPRIMSASMEALPAMMSAMGDFEARMEEVVADLPDMRSYDELTNQERNVIFKATGLTEKEIRANLKAIPEVTEEGAF
jgi:hypothetical protein